MNNQKQLSTPVNSPNRRSLRARINGASALAFALVLGVCPVASFARDYVQTNLVSDVAGVAAITDPHLVGVWGITRTATSPWWVNTTIAGTSLLYNGAGQPFPAANPIVVTIPPPTGMTVPPIPTGITANTGTSFNVAANRPARFIFVTRTGTISGWNPQANATNAIKMVDHGGTADYTGVTLAQRGGVDMLYVANFASGKIEVYDGTFTPVMMPPGAFWDSSISTLFSVFNVQAIGGELYVTYAPKNIFTPTGGGPGQGYVDVYDTSGMLLRRMKHGPWMNAPWGVTLAPDGFGQFSGRVLVAMFGDGSIAGFDPKKGNFHGNLHGTDEAPLMLEKGLWGIGFGNGGNSGSTTSLYFGADFITDGNFHGLFGTITLAPDDDDDESDN